MLFKQEFINFMKHIKNGFKLLKKHKKLVFIIAIFLAYFFLRIYQMDIKYPFGYDQVDNAWAAKNILVNNQFPLVGMVAKANSGVYIGPAYYYLVSFFYWVFNLHPQASQVIALLTALFNFWVLFLIAKKLFNYQVAVIAVLIYAFNYKTLIFEGIQWPVQLLPAVSLIIFYLLYKVSLGEVKKLILLFFTIGIAFNLHFTAIFFPIIVFLALPFLPKTRKTLKYILLSFGVFIIWIIPNLLFSLTNASYGSNTASYFSTYFHGFHLTRMLQIIGDAFIQFDQFLVLDILKPFKIFLLPLFIFAYLFKSFTREKRIFSYLVVLWFMVPWLVFTVYSGEISDYYFITNKFIAVLIISFFINLLWNKRHILSKIVVLVFLLVYCFFGISAYLPYKDEGNLVIKTQNAQKAVDEGRRIEFQVGVSESYIYYYLMKQKGVDVYGKANKK